MKNTLLTSLSLIIVSASSSFAANLYHPDMVRCTRRPIGTMNGKHVFDTRLIILHTTVCQMNTDCKSLDLSIAQAKTLNRNLIIDEDTCEFEVEEKDALMNKLKNKLKACERNQ